jgi:hypothetical protein
MCSGQGVCECGKCVCEQGFTGDDCGCSDDPTPCTENGLVCSGNGACECGKCACNVGFTGARCNVEEQPSPQEQPQEDNVMEDTDGTTDDLNQSTHILPSSDGEETTTEENESDDDMEGGHSELSSATPVYLSAFVFAIVLYIPILFHVV